MNNPCQRFGIKNFSPYALNLWRSNPGLWAYRYIGGVRDQSSPKMLIGNSVENALEFLLYGHDLQTACGTALSNFDLNVKNIDNVDAEEIAEARAQIEPMIKVLHEKWTPPGPLLATQLRCELYFDPIPIPVIGYPDFSFDGLDVELKTTKACPSEPRANNVRQVALYRRARNRLGGLLYVTEKRCEYFEVTDQMMEESLEEMRASAMSLYKFLGLCHTRRDVLEALVPDWDDWQAPKTKVALADVLLAG